MGPLSRPRVLVLTKTTAMGGAERLLMNTLPHLDRERFDYRFAAFDDAGPLADACRGAGLPFAALGTRGLLDPRSGPVLRRRLTQERVALVHAHLPLVGALARVATRGLATRVVYTEHNTQDIYVRASRWLNHATYRWQHRVLAVSEEVSRDALRTMGARARGLLEVVPNGIDLERLDREAALEPEPLPAGPRDALTVLVPASLHWRKGHDVLLDALARLGEGSGPPVHVWLAGEGPEREALEARAAALPSWLQISCLGLRRDAFALMARADVVALPSRYEGHPLALLEALALGRPAVATRVGGVPEIVRDEETGLLVPPEDPAALANALARLRRAPLLRASLGRRAARDVRARFDVRRTVAAIEGAYRSCLAPAPDPSTPAPSASARILARPLREEQTHGDISVSVPGGRAGLPGRDHHRLRGDRGR